jgi:predicted O-methyltransferase YrrM
MDDYQAIEGWFGERDARFYTYQVERVSGPARFVEIGSWKGRSSYCMAVAIRRAGKPIDFWCVDTWEGSDEHRQLDSVTGATLYEEFLTNTRPVREFLKPIRTTSRAAAARFADRSLDFVFIDAAHDYENVLADIETWRPKVAPHGVLAGHDYLRVWPGVIEAVERAFQGRARVYGTCWYVAGAGRAAPRSLREFRKHLGRQCYRWTATGPYGRKAAPRDYQPYLGRATAGGGDAQQLIDDIPPTLA